MKTASILWRLALAGLLIVLAWRGWILLDACTKTVAAIPVQISTAQTDLLRRADVAIAKADAQITKGRKTIEIIANDTDSRLKEAGGSIAGLREDLKPVLTNTATLVKDAQDSMDDLYPDMKAAVESTTVASTSIAHAAQDASAMTREARYSFPRLLEGVDHIVFNSDKTTAASAHVLGNLDMATRPLPKWMRWTFGIAGQVAPVAAGGIGIAAAAGAFQR